MVKTAAPASQSVYYDEYWQRGKEWSPSAGSITKCEHRIFSELLGPGTTCVDYGCGDGKRYGKALQLAGVDYRGFDISAVAVQHGRDAGLNVDQLSADGRVPLPLATAHVVICFEVLEHLLEPDKALQEIHRILVPGGKVVVSVPNIGRFSNRLEFLMTGFLNPGGSPLTARKAPWRDPHIRFFSASMLRRLARACGFVPVQLLAEPLDLGDLPYIYRRARLQRAFSAISRPIAWVGRIWPSLFSARLFLIAAKPVDLSGASPDGA